MIEQQLLKRLRERASNRGIVPVRGEVLADEVGATSEALSSTLERLERAGLLTILVPPPFLVVRLSSWPSSTVKAPVSRPASYSYGKLSNNRLIKSYRPDKDEALLREILDTLGETDPTTFVGAIKNFAPEVIRKALERVRRTRSVRKNRTALFRYLLTKLS